MKKLLKTVTAAVLALTLVLSLGACGIGQDPVEEAQDPVQEAQATVEGMFRALKTLDFEALARYTGDDGFVNDDLGIDELPGDGMAFLQNLLGRMDYEILNAELADEDTVFVNTRITAVDMKPVLGQFFARAMEYAFAHVFDDPAPSDEQMEEEMMKILSEEMAKPDLAAVENEVLIEVEKGENGWTVEGGETLANAVLGGLQTALDELSDSFG